MLSDKAVKASLRVAYGEALADLGKHNNDIVVLDADLSSSTQTKIFAKEFPERFFDMGISEQDAVATAAGLASQGKIPFVSTFAMFATGRAWEQVRNSICYPKFNVKIVATHGGVTVGEDGASHQALEDISIMRSIPNMTVIVPADSVQTKAVIKFVADYNGPVYVRLSRANLPVIFSDDYSFDIAKAKVLKEGSDVTIVSNGETLFEALKCHDMLKNRGISSEIISIPVVKPLDEVTLLESARKTGAVVTVENHSIIGGLGSAVCECLSEKLPVPVKRIGTRDKFGQSGKDTELMVEYGLTAEGFMDDVVRIIEKKRK